MILINSTQNGVIFQCDTCSKFHVEYKNINLNFTQEQLDNIVDYLGSLDCEQAVEQNIDSPYRRKIMLSIRHLTCNLLFYPEEVEELYTLLNHQEEKEEVLQVYKKLLDDLNITLLNS